MASLRFEHSSNAHNLGLLDREHDNCLSCSCFSKRSKPSSPSPDRLRAEGWLSGLRHLTRNQAYGKPYREFESHPFRQCFQNSHVPSHLALTSLRTPRSNSSSPPLSFPTVTSRSSESHSRADRQSFGSVRFVTLIRSVYSPGTTSSIRKLPSGAMFRTYSRIFFWCSRPSAVVQN